MGIGLLFSLAGVSWWMASFAKKHQEKQFIYDMARQYADELGKPLLVVGGPYGSPSGFILNIKAHPCGDVCLDINPSACRGCSEVVIADVRDIPFEDGYFGAAFCSHILEHLPTVDDTIVALQELHRVADRVFICPQRSTILPGHHVRITQVGNEIFIEPIGRDSGNDSILLRC